MRPRRLWLIFIGVLVLSALIVVVVRPDREPKYQGRSLSEWLARLAAGPDGDPPQQAQEAQQAIRHIGTNALPYLLEWVQYERPRWKSSLNRITGGRLGKYDLLLDYKNEPRADQAAEAFLPLGPQACGAITRLLRLMNNTNRDDSVARAAIAIGNMGTNARPALPGLIMLLTNQNDLTVECAIGALKELKLEPQLVVPALANCLLNSNHHIRYFAAQTLGRFGGEARSAVPALVRTLADSDAGIRRCASNALRAIDPKALERLNAPAAEAARKAE